MAKAKKKLDGRGGAGRGQGRHKKYICKTVARRVPVLALPAIEQEIKKYEKN